MVRRFLSYWRVHPVSVPIAHLISSFLAAATALSTFATATIATTALTLRSLAGRTFAIDINAFLSTLGDGAIGGEVVVFESGKIRAQAKRAEGRVYHRQCVAKRFHRAVARHRIDVFPHQLADGGDFEEMSLGIGADESVSVRQSLCAAADVAEKTVAVLRAKSPDDLLRDFARRVVRVLVVGFAPIAGGGRVHVFAGVAAVRVEAGIDFQNRRTRRALVEILAVVEDQQMSRARQSRRNPRDVM